MQTSPFLCLMRLKFCALKITKRPSICGDFKPSSFKLGLFVIKNLSITQEEHTWFSQTFMWLISVIVVSFVSCYAFCNSPKIPDLTPFTLRQVLFPISLKDSHRSAHRLQQGAWMEDSAFPCFLNPPTNSTPPKFPTFLQTAYCICPKCDVKYYQ